MFTPKTLVKDVLIQAPGARKLLMELGTKCSN